MKRYEIELRGQSLQSNLTLTLLHFGQTIRVSLRTTRLPDPCLTSDPQTGELVARVYIQSETLTDEQVAAFCHQFQANHHHLIKCTYRRYSLQTALQDVSLMPAFK